MLTAITPKLPLLKGDQATKIHTEAKAWGANMVRTMGSYPAQLPTKSGYRRTGTYGRMGRTTYGSANGNYEVTFSNPTIYGQYVGGPKDQQAREMERRGWPRVDEVADKLWQQTMANIQRVIRDSVN